MTMIRYETPNEWLKYEPRAIIGALADAKAAVLSLTTVPYQKAWAEKLQQIQLKQEVAGTSRIEGAEFTESELDDALAGEGAEATMTRSQKQARAAVNTYRWISKLPKDRPIDCNLICEIHRRLVTGCDDDHCQPGVIRSGGENVIFGSPKHRGADGGKECKQAFDGLCEALNKSFREHDVLIQGLALHYHIGAMHPFLDGNGRTARAIEALMLQRAGLRDALFISLSNFYYDEKTEYLNALSSVRQTDGDFTAFILFGLRGIALQCRRLLNEINKQISKALYRDMAHELFGTLRSPKKRVLAKRQLAVLNYLLDRSPIETNALFKELKHVYDLQDPFGGFIRDLIALNQLKAISLSRKSRTANDVRIDVGVRLSWPTEITETEFFTEMQNMPKAKTFDFLQKVSSDPVADEHSDRGDLFAITAG